MSKVNIVDSSSLPWSETEQSPFAHRRQRLARAAGGRALGCSLIELPPGARAWPTHWHAGNEEAIYVLAGEGELTIGGETHRIGPGFYAALPAGPAHAHGMRNPGPDVLRYLCMSTMNDPDVVGYPDSDKIGVFVGSAPGGDDRALTAFWPRGAAVDYFDGEIDSDG